MDISALKKSSILMGMVIHDPKYNFRGIPKYLKFDSKFGMLLDMQLRFL